MSRLSENEPRGLYDRESAAHYLSISLRKLDELRHSGIIPAVYPYGLSHPRFQREALDHYRSLAVSE